MCVPPPRFQRTTGYHWVRKKHKFDDSPVLLPLQWNPASRTWTRADEHDVFSAHPYDPADLTYIEPIPYPEASD